MSETLQQNYARGGFTRQLEPGTRPALLMVDFVQAYLNRAEDLRRAGDLEGALLRLEAAVSRDPHNAIAANKQGLVFQFIMALSL